MLTPHNLADEGPNHSVNEGATQQKQKTKSMPSNVNTYQISTLTHAKNTNCFPE